METATTWSASVECRNPKINPIINNYMEENSVNLLFDSKNIFMGAKKLNLTEDVLKKINNELK